MGSLVQLRLHGRSAHTPRADRADAERFLAFVARPLRSVTLGDLQDFADSLAAATRSRAVASVKSLLAFGQRGHDGPLPARAADGQLGAAPGGLKPQAPALARSTHSERP